MGSAVNEARTKTTEESFRRLTLGDEAALVRLIEHSRSVTASGASARLTNREQAMVRVGVLIALDAPWPSYRPAIVDDADGLDLDDLLAVLIAVADEVGSARVIAAAPRIATAAGYDIDRDLDRPIVPGA